MADRNAAVRKYLTEMIGTFVFMFAVLGIVLSGTECVAATALGIGSVLMVMVYASGHISGGHLNPAVSVAAYLRGALPLGDLGPYIVAQLVGALAAFGVGFGLWHDKYATGTLDLTGTVWPAFLAELVFTFALCYVVLHTATSKDSAGNSFYGRKQIFDPDFLAWLAGFRLPEYELTKRDGQYELNFRGPWSETTMWEIPALAIINELRSRAAMRSC